ncbi:MAG: bifunctional diaminohydroxyphosphoribosylaminopyrimidine deaminase/5-amino-6-(5-phosphoribosylamino)uracil reductase RibD [Treponema sp.]|nr:bifunctional diaminohydroxyphosphoribosylaminopyrimidine deaminase/5-amino-6-(5-phosphoribosylamino)uracil reductase RibD [Treponema sp.]
MSSDHAFMERAIELGRRSLPLAGVNPAVGAVLVIGDRVLGEGYHRGPGTPHAEAAALTEAFKAAPSSSTLPPGATLYCTLEPCCHSGAGKRTPPCTEAIIAAGIARVVFACRDPNPAVSGRGAERLRAAGIAVEEGLMAPEAAGLLESFRVSIRERRPFIRLKWAQSVDGRIACRGGISRWITNEAAREAAHELRARHDAVMIGANTLRVDDPRLTVRLAACGDEEGAVDHARPRRIVLAGRRPLDMAARLFSPPLREGTTVLASTDSAALKQCRAGGIRALETGMDGQGLPDLEECLRVLYADGVGSVMVEGGAGLLTSLLRRGLWDAVTIFVAPLILGEGLEAVGDLDILSPDRGIALEGFRAEAGPGFVRMDAMRDTAAAAEERPSCSRA